MKLLTVRQVCELLSISRTTLYAGVRSGSIPKPIYVTPDAPRWREDALRAWLDERAAA